MAPTGAEEDLRTKAFFSEYILIFRRLTGKIFKIHIAHRAFIVYNRER